MKLLFALALALSFWRTAADAGLRLFRKEHPLSVQGNAAETRHDHDAALRSYDALAGSVRGPSQGAAQLDRSTALLGFASPELAPKAAEAATTALRDVEPSLRSRAAYNLGLADEQMGKTEEAMAMYRKALELDPADRDAKVNLELLLDAEQRQKPQSQMRGDKQEQKAPKDAPDQQQKNPSQQSSEPQQGQPPKEGQKKDEKEQKQAAQQEAPQPQAGQPQEKEKQKAQRPEDPGRRSENERLLDALRASEKNLQAWRFAKEKRKDARRHDAEKDW